MRANFFAAFALLLVGVLVASHSNPPPPLDPALGISTLPLWRWGAPPVQGVAPEDLPRLTVFVPQHATGSAVIIAPGGAYLGLPTTNLEGRQVADWFASRGVTAFVLKYRLGAKYPFPIPLEDAQRAVRLVRSLANLYGYSPDRVGFAGFSAGGHLAAVTGTLFHAANATAADPVDRYSDRPDFLVLAYPWLNAMQPGGKYITYCSVIPSLPAAACKEDEQQYSPSLHLTARTPATFLYSTTDDRTVPVTASLDFYNALIRAGVPAEMHIFRHGEHGSGLGQGDAALDRWPTLLEQWLQDQGLLTPARH